MEVPQKTKTELLRMYELKYCEGKRAGFIYKQAGIKISVLPTVALGKLLSQIKSWFHHLLY